MLLHAACAKGRGGLLAVYAHYAYTPYVPIVFDPKKEKANLAKHGVSLTEADGVLNDPRALTIEDELAEDERRFVTLGMNLLGFLRVVVWTGRGDDTRIISARKANRRETRFYEKAL